MKQNNPVINDNSYHDFCDRVADEIDHELKHIR